MITIQVKYQDGEEKFQSCKQKKKKEKWIFPKVEKKNGTNYESFNQMKKRK